MMPAAKVRLMSVALIRCEHPAPPTFRCWAGKKPCHGKDGRRGVADCSKSRREPLGVVATRAAESHEKTHFPVARSCHAGSFQGGMRVNGIGLRANGGAGLSPSVALGQENSR